MGSNCSKGSKDSTSHGSNESAYGEDHDPSKDQLTIPTPGEKIVAAKTNSEEIVPEPSPLPKLWTVEAPTRVIKNKSDLPDFTLYDQATRSLLTGRICPYERKQKVKKVYIVLIGDASDSAEEKQVLENELRSVEEKLDLKGVEVTILNPDLNLTYPEFPFLQVPSILKFLNEVKEYSLVVNLVLLHETTGQLCPPSILTEKEWQTLTGLPEPDKLMVTNWYKQDSFARDSQYVLSWPTDYADKIKNATFSEYKDVIKKASSECMEIAKILAKSSEYDKNKCSAKSPLESLVPQLTNSKNPITIWVERKFKNKESLSTDIKDINLCSNQMQLDRLEDLRNDLGDKVTAGNKVTYEVDWSSSKSGKEPMKEMVSKVHHRVVDVIQSSGFNNDINFYVKDGIKAPLRDEIENHHYHCKYLCEINIERDDILHQVKEYIVGSSKEPLLLYGDTNCGLSSLVATIAANTAKWVPDACIVTRFIGLTVNSSIADSLAFYLLEHCLLLLGNQNLKWVFRNAEKFLTLLNKATPDRPLVILLDGLNEIDALPWLPEDLPNHVKLVLSTTGSPEPFGQKIQKIRIESLDCHSAKKLLKSHLERDNRFLPENAWESIRKGYPNELALRMVSKCILTPTAKMTESKSIEQLLNGLHSIFAKEPLERILSCLSVSRVGLTDSEMFAIFHSWSKESTFSALDFIRFLNFIRPFISRKVEDGILLSKWSSATIQNAMEKSFLNTDAKIISISKFMRNNLLKMKVGVMLKDIFYENGKDNASTRALQEASCIELQTTGDFSYIFSGKWLLAKLSRCGPFKILDDIDLSLNKFPNNEDLNVMKEFIILSSSSLDYEPAQIYTQIHQRLKGKPAASSSKLIGALVKEASSPPVPSLISFSPCLLDSLEATPSYDISLRIDDVYIIKNNSHHMITTSVDAGELIVWNIHTRQPVRILKGLKQPRNVKMIDDLKCIVLCDRELKIYNLDIGEFLMKLREMMNQRSPYFGLCDSDHVVALSRSRMNVNLMNLSNGTCVTTFKVGENRFLSSLIVSANGKICVCGDETPSALVMWNLEERKLIYELKMPNHEYYPKLAAITDDGTYVSCVCREVEEPAPNFIVVYELQSGTLFKRWKPEADTISITISTTGITCVIIGLDNCRIMAYDLILGNLRWTVSGHTSPVDTLKVDRKGSVLLSFDSTGKDRSLRVWNLETGANLATFTPDGRISACELTNDGDAVVFALEGQAQIHTLFLCHNKSVCELKSYQEYGSTENKGKIFELGQVLNS